MVLFIDLIIKTFGLENSLFSQRRIKEFVSLKDYQMSEQKKFSIAFYRLRKMSHTVEVILLSNVLKACVDEIDNTQEKDKKLKNY